jgi:hypothetical protein
MLTHGSLFHALLHEQIKLLCTHCEGELTYLRTESNSARVKKPCRCQVMVGDNSGVRITPARSRSKPCRCMEQNIAFDWVLLEAERAPAARSRIPMLDDC